MTKGVVFDIKRYSIHDGPGIRTAVFLKGCPLHCRWCHNPEGQSVEKELIFRSERCIGCGECTKACLRGAIRFSRKVEAILREECGACGMCAVACPTGTLEMTGREMTVEEVMDEIDKDIAFYDESKGGVTFSGGEPLMQPEFLEALLEACRGRGIHTAVETSGFGATGTLLKIKEKADLFLYDLKQMDPKKHLRETGVSNRLILKNLRVLAEKGTRVHVRIPLIPGVNDDDENISSTMAFVSSLPGLRTLDVLPYHSGGSEKCRRLGLCYGLPDLKIAAERMDQVVQIASAHGLEVKIGG